MDAQYAEAQSSHEPPLGVDMSAKPVASESQSGKLQFGRPALLPGVASARSLPAVPATREVAGDERAPSFKQIRAIRRVAESAPIVNAAGVAARPITRIDDLADLEVGSTRATSSGTVTFIAAARAEDGRSRASEEGDYRP
jgi:hypothetical protein